MAGPHAHFTDVVRRLGLAPHPEGGFYRETWRAERTLTLADYEGERSAGTAILFLLPTNVVSRWHRVRSDELWLWQGGDPAELRLGEAAGEAHTTVELASGGRVQALVPAGVWQSTVSLGGAHGYTLFGCVVVPGFDFRDFELADRL